MAYDLELMRDLMLSLEAQQQSPRVNIVISVEDEAFDLARTSEAVEESLNILLDLEYIDGAGEDEPGFWLFRKLTRKGVQFVRATREPRDWERLKQHFAARGSIAG